MFSLNQCWCNCQRAEIKERYIGYGEMRLKKQKQFLLRPFLVYRDIIFSLICREGLSWECNGIPLFSCFFANCNPVDNAVTPETQVRHSTGCSRAKWSLADSRALQLMLDTDCSCPHIRMRQPWQGWQVHCSLFWAFLIVPPRSFPAGSFAFWFEQWVYLTEKEQQWGFGVLLCHLFQVFWLSTLLGVFWRATIALAAEGEASPMC